jgi:hypothetical protein
MADKFMFYFFEFVWSCYLPTVKAENLKQEIMKTRNCYILYGSP